ncbi:hypothetical protein [Floccifex sp.]|nr:hypothetical protein [Floccifex sp.]MDD7281412.1 hypothetical protein [Erysipelotrichaceae bacterium]MDY2959114.1 hypothetical protein [Floccifex sp.]
MKEKNNLFKALAYPASAYFVLSAANMMVYAQDIETDSMEPVVEE